jgi:hypothetical protein
VICGVVSLAGYAGKARIVKKPNKRLIKRRETT